MTVAVTRVIFCLQQHENNFHFCAFPGNLSKSETRDLARHYKLTISDKPDSQDICFVPDGNYARIVRDLHPGSHVSGEIVHIDGAVVGRHDGIINFTVGQRRGLDVGGTKERLYVVRIDPETRRVFVGPRAALGQSRFPVGRVNWLVDYGEIPIPGGFCLVKVRSSSQPVRATVFPRPENSAEVFLDVPVDGVAPGQACVFYDGDRVVGEDGLRGRRLGKLSICPVWLHVARRNHLLPLLRLDACYTVVTTQQGIFCRLFHFCPLLFKDVYELFASDFLVFPEKQSAGCR